MTFGLRHLPPKTLDGEAVFDTVTFDTLDTLIARTLTGKDALNVVAFEINRLEPGSAELLQRIIRKNLLAGFSESSLNKVCKGVDPRIPLHAL